MKKYVQYPLFVFIFFYSALFSFTYAADDYFIIKQSDESPEAIVESLEFYAKEKEWLYLGADKVKKDTVTLVKFCIPEIGKQIWPEGLHLSAMLPCGNVGIYQKEGKTEISILNPRYMNLIYPSPVIEKAGIEAENLIEEMLAAILGK